MVFDVMLYCGLETVVVRLFIFSLCFCTASFIFFRHSTTFTETLLDFSISCSMVSSVQSDSTFWSISSSLFNFPLSRCLSRSVVETPRLSMYLHHPVLQLLAGLSSLLHLAYKCNGHLPCWPCRPTLCFYFCLSEWTNDILYVCIYISSACSKITAPSVG